MIENFSNLHKKVKQLLVKIYLKIFKTNRGIDSHVRGLSDLTITCRWCKAMVGQTPGELKFEVIIKEMKRSFGFML